jgi:hypothetical protein
MKSSSALQRLKEARTASRSGTHPTAAAQHSAAASDADNEAYMQAFNQAFEHLTAGQIASKQPDLHSKQQGHAHVQSRPTTQGASSSAAAKISHVSSRISSISAARDLYADQGSVASSQHAIAPGWRTGPTDEAGMPAATVRALLCWSHWMQHVCSPTSPLLLEAAHNATTAPQDHIALRMPVAALISVHATKPSH